MNLSHLAIKFSIFKILFSSLLLGIGINSFGQEQDRLPKEENTYQLFQEENWTQLIVVGKQAIKEDLDYFYLRMRIGIAYYNKKNYSTASKHFTKALFFSSNDELAKEYLYYCYLYLGQNEEARKLTTSFSQELKKKIGLNKQSSVDFLEFEGASKQYEGQQYFDYETNTNQDYFSPALYIQTGIKHYVKNKVSFFHAGTFFKQKTYSGNSQQIQYYLQSKVSLKNNWVISPAIHLVNTSYKNKTTTFSYINFPPYYQSKTQYKTTSNNYFVGSISLQKTINKLKLSLGTTLSNTSNINQYNHFGNFSYYPFGNSKLVLGLTTYMHTANDYNTLNTAWAPYLYFEPLKSISIKLSYLNNKGNNIIETNGYLVNNSLDLTLSRYSTLVNFRINKHISLYGMYQLELKENSFLDFNYNYNTFLVGVKVSPNKR